MVMISPANPAELRQVNETAAERKSRPAVAVRRMVAHLHSTATGKAVTRRTGERAPAAPQLNRSSR
jgi:hypothetical protein